SAYIGETAEHAMREGHPKKDSKKSNFFRMEGNQSLMSSLLRYPDGDRIDPTCAPPTHYPDVLTVPSR
ncbi:hypothetical protein ACCT25_36585, partial [Rhizobium ruizarguesonis]